MTSVSERLDPPELFNFSAPRSSTLPYTIQPSTSEPYHPRLSPNNTPIVKEELFSTPEHHIYRKYFYIQTTPPSPMPQVPQPAEPLKLVGSLSDLRPPKPDEVNPPISRPLNLPSLRTC